MERDPTQENVEPWLDPALVAAGRDGDPSTATGEPTVPFLAPPPDLPGYEILGELGRGGMGVVYRARQTALNRLVAIKILRSAEDLDLQRLARFWTEAQILARLQHPNIVQVYDSGTHAGRTFLVLEYVAGGNLERFLLGRPQPPGEAARLVATLAHAIQAAHDQGIIHRDLKPANVLIERAEERHRSESRTPSKGRAPSPNGKSAALHPPGLSPKITDFGLAKVLRTSAEDGAKLTNSQAILGTPAYMAPEQAAGKSREVGPAADIYSLGVILFECLTGRPPFQAATAPETLMLVLLGDPVPPRRLQPGIPRDLETIVLRCLEALPGRRYATAGDLADDLDRFLAGEPIRARPASLAEKVGRWARRRPAVAGLLAALIVVVLASLAGLTTLYLRAEEQRARAEEARIDAEHQRAAADRERGRAEEHYAQARAAIRTYFELVKEDPDLDRFDLHPLRLKLLQAAVPAMEDLARREGDDPILLKDRAFALTALAHVRWAMGRREEALADQALACALYDRLTAAAPADAALAFTALAERNNYASHLQNQGQIAEAAAAFRQGLDRLVPLRRAFPGDPLFQFVEAQFSINLAVILRLQRDDAGADRAADHSRALLEPLVADYPEDVESGQLLAWVYQFRASRLVDLRQLAAAEAGHRQAVALLESLRQGQPRSVRVRQRLAEAFLDLAEVQAALGQLAPATAAARQGLALAAPLAAEFPSVIALRHYHFNLQQRLARLEADQALVAEADRDFAEAVTLGEALVRDQPRVAQYHLELAQVLNNRASLLMARGRAAEAVPEFRRAEALLRPWTAGAEPVADYLRDLAKIRGNLALGLERLGQPAAAVAALREAVATGRRLVALAPRPEWRVLLASHLGDLGQQLSRHGDPAEAQTVLDQSLAELRDLVREFPDDRDIRRQLARGLGNLGAFLASQERAEEALAVRREALALQTALAAADPPATEDLLALGGTCMVLGTALGPAEGESVLRQGIAALEPLTRGPMPLATAAVQLGGCWCNLGNLRTTAGDLPGALEAYDQAQGILRPLAEEAGPASARAFLANTLRGRALALGRLGRHAEVLADLDRSRALGGATEPAMRFLRAWTLGQVGRHTEAGLEGNALLAHDPRPEARLAVAGLWAQAAAATAAAPDLAEAYAARAVDLVREAQARGYRQWEVLRRDPALAPLRDRPDFRALVGPEP